MIKSKLLKKYKNINHGFFNKVGGKSVGMYKSLNCGTGSSDNKNHVKKNLGIVSNKIGCKKSRLVLIKQIHSNKIHFVKKNTKRKIVGDGMITSQRGLALGILTADCAPILFYDPKKVLIGAAHAGWKGAYKNIAKKMTNYFIKRGSKINDINVIIGPCISKSNYEVKNDFKKKFLRLNKYNKIHFFTKKNKIYFSLNGFLKAELVNLGHKNIEIINKNTYNPKNNFFSARRSLKRNETDYGRNISVIMLK